MQILVELEVLECRIHGGTGVALEVLTGVRCQDVCLHRDVVDEALFADRAAHTSLAEHLLGPGVVVCGPRPGPAHVVLRGVAAPTGPGLLPLPGL